MAEDGSGVGAGELAAGVDKTIGSAWSPALLSMAVSLSVGLRSLLLCWDTSLMSLNSSLFRDADFSFPFQDGISQMTPVKLFRWNGLRIHFRQGLPDRSSARKPALIAPWFALGPSLWPPTPATAPTEVFALWSIVPSSLQEVSMAARSEHCGEK